MTAAVRSLTCYLFKTKSFAVKSGVYPESTFQTISYAYELNQYGLAMHKRMLSFHRGVEFGSKVNDH